MILLQAVQTIQDNSKDIRQVGITDVIFRITDVIMIVGGVITVLGVYFVMKYKLDRYSEILTQHIMDTTNENNRLHLRIDDTRKEHTELEREGNKKFDELKTQIQQMEIRIIEKISEVKSSK